MSWTKSDGGFNDHSDGAIPKPVLFCTPIANDSFVLSLSWTFKTAQPFEESLVNLKSLHKRSLNGSAFGKQTNKKQPTKQKKVH